MRAFPLLLLLLLTLSGCERPAATATPTLAAPTSTVAAALTTVQLFFTDNALPELSPPRAVPRDLPASDDPATLIAATLRELLKGPSAAERAEGLDSWFSDATAAVPVRVALSTQGDAVVDFGDFSRIIPNASTSFGIQKLMAELNHTLFQFQDVITVTYQFDGSCDAFWGWLQAGCQTISRGEWEAR